jgi:hypothetical protein
MGRRKGKYLWPDEREPAGFMPSKEKSSVLTPVNDDYPDLPGTGKGYTSTCDHYGDEPCLVLSTKDQPDIILSGASGYKLFMFEGLKLVIDCAGMVDLTVKPFVKTGPEEIQLLETPDPSMAPCPVVRLDWGDRCAPGVPIQWWYKLLTVIKEKYVGHIAVACMGGHGRTGTALCALLLAHDKNKDPEEAVTMIREHHCDRAVESASQFAYLAKFRPEWVPTKWYAKKMKETVSTYCGTNSAGTIADAHYNFCMKNKHCLDKEGHLGVCRYTQSYTPATK